MSATDPLATILCHRVYEPAPLPAMAPFGVRLVRICRVIARQLSPLGWALVFGAIAIGAAIAAFT